MLDLVTTSRNRRRDGRSRKHYRTQRAPRTDEWLALLEPHRTSERTHASGEHLGQQGEGDGDDILRHEGDEEWIDPAAKAKRKRAARTQQKAARAARAKDRQSKPSSTQPMKGPDGVRKGEPEEREPEYGPQASEGTKPVRISIPSNAERDTLRETLI